MKKLAFLFGMMVVAMCLITTNVSAQINTDSEDVTFTMPAMKVLDVVGTQPVLTFAIPTTGGEAIAPVQADGSWLNYTSVIAEGSTNKITVQLDAESGTVPAGTILKVQAGVAQNGNGTFGVASDVLVLDNTAKDLVTLIGSCYTGTGEENGRKLTYTWSVDGAKYADLKTTSNSQVTATYTIVATVE